jgi:Fe-Mn family superoxide dismutase
MTHILPPLPYGYGALEPVIDVRTVEIHYDRHHRTYVNNLNNLIPGTPSEHLSLEEIIKTASGPIFNNAAQIWNHTFYWEGLTAPGTTQPSEKLLAVLSPTFGSLEQFKKQFTDAAIKTFGSGWAWLVKTPSGDLKIISTSNAGCPIVDGNTPLLTCDVWEHAYYLGYQNRRAEYVEKFWDIVNWEKVEARLI